MHQMEQKHAGPGERIKLHKRKIYYAQSNQKMVGEYLEKTISLLKMD